jgi:hypothetical protein
MYKTNQIVKHRNKIQYQNLQSKSKRIISLNDSVDDDLYKIYYIESQHLRNKWYRVIATAFGATSCSCEEQTKNPYQSCSHMKRLDNILKDTPNDIQTLNQIRRFILEIF